MAPTKRSSSKGAVSKSTRQAATATPEPNPQPLPLPSTPNNNKNQPPSTGEQERLFHAQVSVELTAEPITQIITDMAARAIQSVNTKAAASVPNNIRDFNWVGLAQEAIAEAEVTAKQAVIELIGPVAQQAWVAGRAPDELQMGSPIFRQGRTTRSSKPARNDGEKDGTPVPSIEAQAQAETVKLPQALPNAASSDIPMVNNAGVEAAQQRDAAATEEVEDPNRLLCFCYQPGNGEVMYACDNGANCRHEWYHESCLKRVLKKKDFPKPDKGWLCPYCGNYRPKAIMAPLPAK